jgi:diguanylate cyclase (GGDEF)-like protein/PAS domain S-box-containing protein
MEQRVGEMTSLAERMGYLQAVRAGFVIVVLASGIFAGDLVGVSFGRLALVTVAYLVASLAGEGLRRLIGARALYLVAGGLLLDGAYLAWVVYCTGATQSPLRFLVFIHLIAVTILASYRSGLKIALWHSLLIFGGIYLQAIGVLEPVRTKFFPEPTSGTFERLSMFNVIAFWLVALGAAAVSSINERELRRRKADLEALAGMTVTLENLTEPAPIAGQLLSRISDHFGFKRGLVFSAFEESVELLASHGADIDDYNPEPGWDSTVERAWDQRRPVLVKALDPDADPRISALLHDARNVMVVPLLAEGSRVGLLVLERGGKRNRLPRQVVSMVAQFGSHGALALRSSWLMAKVQKMAETDPLTGAANRRALEKILGRELSRATRNSKQVTLVMLDVDHFKSFNDSFGHQAGDEVLKGVVTAITRELRNFDVVARYGGEEFAVVLPDCTADEAGIVAERLRAAVGSVEAERVVTASAGVSTFPNDATEAEALIGAADAALYASKHSGRDRVTLFRRLADTEEIVVASDVATDLLGDPARRRNTKRDVPSAGTREKALARAGAALMGARSVDEVCAAVVSGASALQDADGLADVVMAVGSPDGFRIVETSGTSNADRSSLSLQQIQRTVGKGVLQGRSIELRFTAKKNAVWGFGQEPLQVLAIPVMVQDQLGAVLLLASDAGLSEEVKYALEVLAAKATLALERLSLANDIKRIEAGFQSLVRNSSDVISVLEADGTIVYQTSSIEHMLDSHPQEFVGSDFTDMVHPDDAPDALAFLKSLSTDSDDVALTEWRVRHRSGRYVLVSVVGKNMLDDDNVGGLVLTMRDVSERKALEEELEHLTSRDSLTELGNRSFFLQHLEDAQGSKRSRTKPLTVLLIDLDDFKTVNDGLGHAAGDELLVEVAERLRLCLRTVDSVARLGGDEFALLLPETTGKAGAQMVAKRIIDSLRMPFEVGAREVYIHASIGIAVDDADSSAPELLRNADVALHMAKSRGKNCFAVFEASMHEAAIERLDLLADLQRAVEQHEFRLVFQPVVALSTGAIVGTEALLRWAHPERGIIQPSEFIPLAEETGLIVPLGAWVLRQACFQAREWQERYGSDFTIAVNLAAAQLQHPDLVAQVETILGETGLDPKTLVLEITESVLLDDVEVVADRLAELRALGLRVALDDFGTGYSSLGYLRKFPIDILKIDRSFVDGMETSDTGALVDGILRIGQSLKMETVAEGIEHLYQAERLDSLGCELGQGFFFSKPVGSDLIEAMLLGTLPVG